MEEVRSKFLVATVAAFRNFPSDNPIKNSVVIFWESHTNNPTDKEKIQSTVDLVLKRFDPLTCERYEVRTGYLSRYNYLSKPLAESSVEELQEAVIKGEEEQSNWIKRCSPALVGFNQLNWQTCINRRENPSFLSCKEKLLAKIKEDKAFSEAYQQSAEAYAIKRNTNLENGLSYLVEENSWILSLPYLYPEKKIYIIHVGNVTTSTTILFSTFDYLKKSALLLFPCFSHETFATEGDFKFAHDNKRKLGYFAEEFNCISSDKSNTFSKLLTDMKADNELLSNIIAQLPGHIYWMNKNYTYIGCNNAQAEQLGLKSRNEIVGKTVYDLLSLQDATKHNNINKQVLERNRSYEGEEKIKINGKEKIYLSKKRPLINSAGKNVGLLGISIDITDKKEAQILKEKRRLEREKLAKEKETYDLVRSIAHDIRTPLCVLASVAKEASLPESQHTNLRNAVEKIDRILSELLMRYNENVQFQKEVYTCIQITLKEVVKYSGCKYPNVSFEYINDENAQDYIFVKADYSDFCRAMINLINNAAEACEEGGKVRVGFIKEGGNVIISVKDNGVGMSSDTVERINSGGKVLEIKKNGHGLGLQQVHKVIEDMHGVLTVQSEKNEGSEFKVKVVICEAPRWFSDCIRLKRGDIVVVLDDDPLVYDIWKRIFKPFEKQISLKFVEKGLEAISFINSLKNKSEVFLLADYELRNQPLNGIDVIERTGLQERHLLVTSMYVSSIRDFDKKSEFLKTFRKNGNLDKLKIFVE